MTNWFSEESAIDITPGIAGYNNNNNNNNNNDNNNFYNNIIIIIGVQELKDLENEISTCK